MNNILLTGEIQVGKSTIINKICSLFGDSAQGFHTIAFANDEPDTDSLFILPYHINEPSFDDKPFAIRNKKSRERFAFPEVFDKCGVEILSEAKDNPKTKLIIMDELGFFENDAKLFQEKVIECLSGKLPVLGVIKPRSTEFLDRIRNLSNVNVITVNEENRDKISLELSQEIAKTLL